MVLVTFYYIILYIILGAALENFGGEGKLGTVGLSEKFWGLSSFISRSGI